MNQFHQESKPFREEPTWTPKVCKIMASMAIIMGLGLSFCILLGFRYIQLLQLSYPQGPRTQLVGFVPKHNNINGSWDLKLDYVGPWSLKVMTIKGS